MRLRRCTRLPGIRPDASFWSKHSPAHAGRTRFPAVVGRDPDGSGDPQCAESEHGSEQKSAALRAGFSNVAVGVTSTPLLLGFRAGSQQKPPLGRALWSATRGTGRSPQPCGFFGQLPAGQESDQVGALVGAGVVDALNDSSRATVDAAATFRRDGRAQLDILTDREARHRPDYPSAPAPCRQTSGLSPHRL